MLREYQATNTPSAVPTPALAPKPAPEPQDPPKRVFSFSKPAAPEPEVEDPAKEEPKAAEPFKPAYRFSVPKPAAPEPRHEAPQEEALKPAFSSFMPASPPAPGTAAPAPKPAAPAPTPSPAPATVIKPKVRADQSSIWTVTPDFCHVIRHLVLCHIGALGGSLTLPTTISYCCRPISLSIPPPPPASIVVTFFWISSNTQVLPINRFSQHQMTDH